MNKAFPVRRGGHPVHVLETSDEMALVGKSARCGDVRERQVCVVQQMQGALDLDLPEVFREGAMKVFRKFAGDVDGVDTQES